MGGCWTDDNFVVTDKPYYFLDLDVRSWARESHGLFDYDNKYIDHQRLRIASTGMICNYDNILDAVIPKNAFSDEELNKLFTVVFKNGRYWLYHNRDFDDDDRIK